MSQLTRVWPRSTLEFIGGTVVLETQGALMDLAIATGCPAVRSTAVYLVPERGIARKEHAPTGRALHIIDLENLAAGDFTPQALACAWHQFSELAAVQRFDHLIAATNPKLAVAAGLV